MGKNKYTTQILYKFYTIYSKRSHGNYKWTIYLENRGTISAIQSSVNFEISINDKKRDAFLDSLNHLLKNLKISQNNSSDLLEYLKKELNSQDGLIKSLTEHTDCNTRHFWTKSNFDSSATGKAISPQKYIICCTHRLKREHWRHLQNFWFRINNTFSHKLACRFSIKSANPKN